MSKETIYKALIAGGLNHIGACAVMGNMMAESALRANNAQDGMTKLTDEDYTASADLGAIDFINDKVGYGLCQWTFWTRKSQLLNYCRSRGVSVGDEAAQVGFCIQELRKDYASLFQRLTTADNLYNAVSAVCREYEQPAVNNIDRRFAFAREIEEALPSSAGARESTSAMDASVAVLQLVMNHNGYPTPVNGVKTVEFTEKFTEFARDVVGG